MKTFAKRSLAFLLTVMMLFSVMAVGITTASAATIAGGSTLYLQPACWQAENGRFAAYFFNASGNAWADATVRSDDSTTYDVTVPAGNWTNVIFCRMNSSTTENNWDNKWNQTADLVYDGTNNCYTISDWEDSTGKCPGTWSTYTEKVVYFVNTKAWANVYAYTTTPGIGSNTSWPGKAATLVDSAKSVYSYNPGDRTQILFNPGDDSTDRTSYFTCADVYGKYIEPKTNTVFNTAQEAWDAANANIEPETTATTAAPTTTTAAPTASSYKLSRVYFDNSSTNWSTVYIYGWSTGVNGTFALTKVAGTNYWYYDFSTPVTTGTSFLFKNSASFDTGTSQTGEVFVTEPYNCYNPGTNQWSTYTPAATDAAEEQYCLVGSIDGKNVGCDEDYTTVTNKFVNNQITMTFTKDSYVFVKDTTNTNWYMFQSYCTDTTGTLYNTSTGTSEKMYVPAGTHTFTVVKNSNGTLTLSYTTATVATTATTTATTAPTTAATVATYETIAYTTQYFPACSASYTALNAALQSIGVDNSKTNRARIAAVNGITDYTYTSEQNTQLLNLLKAGKLVNPDYVAPSSYCVVGYINGKDVDYNTSNLLDSNNQITMTFTEKSYVFLKDANSKSYMTKGWAGEDRSSVDLYDTSISSTIEWNKLCVPAGTYTLTAVENEAGYITLSYAAYVEPTTATTAATTATTAKTEYCLVGYIDGADVGDGSDWDTVVNKFDSNNQVTVTFAKTSYVFVKDTACTTAYKTWGYEGQVTETILYNTSTNTLPEGTYWDKLFVPAGTFTFTMATNVDGTIKLSYVAKSTATTAATTATSATSATYTENTKYYPACDSSATSFYNGLVSIGVSGTYSNRERIAIFNGVTDYIGSSEQNTQLLTLLKNGQLLNPDYVAPTTAAPATTATTATTAATSATSGKYCVVGYIDGKNVGCEGDYASIINVMDANNKITLTFAEESYVFIKDVTNTNWYMFQSYCTDTTGTLYNTSTGTKEKMYVPAGTFTFTVTEQNDGTILLSYVKATSSETTATSATYETNSYVTKYFPACSSTITTLNEGLKAIGVDNSKDNRTRIANYNGIADYTFSSEQNNQLLTLLKNGQLLNPDYPGATTAPTATAAPVTSTTATSASLGNYHVVGYIDGKNVGCEEDYASMVNRMDANNKITLTFAEDSYVFLKDTKNENWYMTLGWVGEVSSAMLYNTNTALPDGIAFNKLYVPAGTFTFTATKQNDGTILLSYVKATAQETTATQNTTKATEATYPTAGKYYPACDSKYTSFYPAMESIGYTNISNDWDLHCRIAEINGITGFTGTAAQNTTLLNLLKAGVLLNPDYVEETTKATDAPVTGTLDTLYLIPGANWTKDDARFAAYFFDGSRKAWVDMTDADGDGTYEVAIPDGTWENVIFCRMNPEVTANSWYNVWNQTNDLIIEAPNNCFTITDPWNTEDTGVWSVIEVKPTTPSESTQPTTESTAPTTESTVPSSIPEDGYCLVGEINGATIGDGDNWNKVVNILYNNKITLTISKDSYVFLKDTACTTAYKTMGWQGNVSAAKFYNTATTELPEGTNWDKLYVPAGTFTFVITPQADGTILLSYSGEYAPTTPTTKPTETTPSETTKPTETTPVETKDPATSSAYYPACDPSHTSFITALNSLGIESTKFNRIKIAAVNGIAPYTGSSEQNDKLLALLKAGKLINPDYVGSDDYCLVGFINGTDVGIGEKISEVVNELDSNNQITLTFDQNSYVCLKDTTCTTTYMTMGWLDNVTEAVLYNTATTTLPDGKTWDKLFVPAGTFTFTVTKNDNGTLLLSYTGTQATTASTKPTATTKATEETKATEATIKPVSYFPACLPSYTSLISALQSLGIDSSKEYRAEIAAANGITDYTYSAEQNEALLKLLKEGKLINPDGTTEGYCLVGSIDGANVGCEDDWNKVVNLFKDNKITLTFKQKSYVFVKDAACTTAYMTMGWQGEVSQAILYNSAKTELPEGSNWDKLYVPAGTFTFTITNQADGSMILSYTGKEVPETTEPSTTPTATTPKPTTPTFTDKTLYLVPDVEWSAEGARFAAYFFKGSENIWVSMTDTNKDGVFEVNIPTGDWTNVIFCRMSGASKENNWDNKINQTNDLTIDSKKNCFTITDPFNDKDTGAWSVFDPNKVPTTPSSTEKPSTNPTDTTKPSTNPSVPVVENGYCLVGYINGKDVGCGDEWDKVVNQFDDFNQITMTFEDTSYVYVKDTACTTAYMTIGYAGQVSKAVLYNTSTTTLPADTTFDKLYVPAGTYTFTVVEKDGNINLSYIKTADAPTTKPTEKAPTLSTDFKSLKAGKTYTIGVNNAGNRAVSFKSNMPKVAKVDANGKVTALKRGVATITVTIGDTELTCKVDVTTNPTVNRTSVTVKKNKTVKVKLTGKANAIDNKYKNSKKAAVISKVSAKKIKIKGLKPGTSKIKIKVNGVKTLKVRVTVVK